MSGATSTPARARVCFARAFRGGDCIAHVTVNGEETLCGRLVACAETVEPDPEAVPDCRACARVEASK